MSDTLDTLMSNLIPEEEGVDNSNELIDVEEQPSEGSTEDSSEEGSEEVESKETKNSEEEDLIDIEDTSEGADSSSTEATGDSPKGSNSLQAFAKALVEEGQLSTIKEEELKEVKTFKDLSKLIQKEVEGREFSDLSDKQKELLRGIREGVPADYMLKSMSQEEQLASLDEDSLRDNEDVQAELYKADLMAKGFSEEKAILYVAKMKEADQLFNESLEALENLKARQQKSREDAIKSAQTQKENFKKMIDKTEQILPGLPVNKEMRDRIYKSITNLEMDENGQYVDPVVKTKNANPEKFVMTLHYLHELGVFRDDFDPSIFGKAQKKKAVEEFEKTLSSQNNTYTDTGTGSNRENSDTDMDLLKGLDSLFG